MENPIKPLIKRLLATAGLELKKIDFSNSEEACASRLLRKASCDLLVDVGANEGQYGKKVIQTMPRIRVLSFEPLSTAHDRLSQVARQYPRWSVAERCAIGNEDGFIEINVSGNSVSSSILPMESAHRDAAPESSYVGRERVPIRRLDTVLPTYLAGDERVYLKTDTQGYEKNVVLGAQGIMGKVSAMQLELSLVQLYSGQTLAFEMIEFLRSLGFLPFAFSNVFSNEITGELLQMDGFFINSKILSTSI